MKPLSALKYYWENKKKASLIAVILLLIVLAISAIQSMVVSGFDSSEATTLRYLQKASIVFSPSGGSFLSDETMGKIEDFEGVKEIIPIDEFEQTVYNSIIAPTESIVLFSDRINSTQELMDRFGLSIKDGRLPNNNEYEIVMHEDLLLNKGLKIGDEFGGEVDENEWMQGRYKIVGSLKGKNILSFGTKNFGIEMWKDSFRGTLDESDIETIFGQPRVVLVFPKDSIEQMNSNLQTLDKNQAQLLTYEIRYSNLEGEISSIQNVLGIILTIVLIAMGVSVGAIIMIAYNERKSEFGILSAIGYSKRDIVKLVCKEIGLLSLVCTAIGYGISMFLLFILNISMFAPAGKPLTLFSSLGLIFTLIVPVVVFVCSIVPIIRQLKKTDLVSVIEGR